MAHRLPPCATEAAVKQISPDLDCRSRQSKTSGIIALSSRIVREASRACSSSPVRITSIGEPFNNPVRRVSPRLVPKVACPSRSTFCIAPARSPVMVKGNPKSKPPYPATKTRTYSR